MQKRQYLCNVCREEFPEDEYFRVWVIRGNGFQAEMCHDDKHPEDNARYTALVAALDDSATSHVTIMDTNACWIMRGGFDEYFPHTGRPLPSPTLVELEDMIRDREDLPLRARALLGVD